MNDAALKNLSFEVSPAQVASLVEAQQVEIDPNATRTERAIAFGLAFADPLPCGCSSAKHCRRHALEIRDEERARDELCLVCGEPSPGYDLCQTCKDEEDALLEVDMQMDAERDDELCGRDF